jgi:hypothetical protein
MPEYLNLTAASPSSATLLASATQNDPLQGGQSVSSRVEASKARDSAELPNIESASTLIVTQQVLANARYYSTYHIIGTKFL